MMMSLTRSVRVLGHEIGENQYPRLYKLGKDDPAKLRIVVKLFAEHGKEKEVPVILSKIENSVPLMILGMEVDPFVFPAIYCWYHTNPDNFIKFFQESVEKMWGGDKKAALKMVEEYFEKGVR